MAPKVHDNLVSMWAETVHAFPLREAVVQPKPEGEPDCVPFIALEATARVIARDMDQRNIGPIVATAIPQSLPFICLALAVWKSGRTLLPLNPRMPAAELQAILNDAGAKDSYAIAPVSPVLKDLTRQVELEPVCVQIEADLKKLASQYGVKAGVNLGVMMMTMAWGVLNARLPYKDKTDLADKPAVLLYTSGTSGTPKGVVLSHRNLASNVLGVKEILHVDNNIRSLGILPVFHSFGLTAGVLLPLMIGGCYVPFPTTNPTDILQAMETYRINCLKLVPSLARFLARAQAKAKKDIHLAVAASGGEKMLPEIGEAFEAAFGTPLLEGYGLTETSPVVSFNTGDARRISSVGKALPGTQVVIVNPETRQPVPAGDEGEVCIKGPGVMLGYHNRPQETAEVLTDGLFHTGDMGKVDPDGYLYITGRLKEMIIVGGENVWPAEVENVLIKNPDVAEAGVIGITHPRSGEQVMACVTLKEGRSVEEAALQTFCRENLAGFKVPKKIKIVEKMPHTPTGKVLRRALKGEFEAAE